MQSPVRIRPTDPDDADWIDEFVARHWATRHVVIHGSTYVPSELPGFVAFEADRVTGHLSYRIAEGACEIVTLAAEERGAGIGTALIAAVREEAAGAGCRRLWLITHNDNVDALRFYQRRGFRIAAVHRDAITRAREIKPEIPEIGRYGIPLRDEIELELQIVS